MWGGALLLCFLLPKRTIVLLGCGLRRGLRVEGGRQERRVLGWRSKLAKRLQQNNFAAMIEGGG